MNFLTSVVNEGQISRQIYNNIRRQAAASRIQTYFRMYRARKAYKALSFASICIQAGIRGMAAREELLFRRQTSAAIVIQVNGTILGDLILSYNSFFFHCFV